jgi:hypothetical protein
MRRSWRRLSPPSLFSFHLLLLRLPHPLPPAPPERFESSLPAGRRGRVGHTVRAPPGRGPRCFAVSVHPNRRLGPACVDAANNAAPRHHVGDATDASGADRSPPTPRPRRGCRLESPNTRCVASSLLVPPPPSYPSLIPSRGALRRKTKRVVVAARPAVPNSNQFVSVSMLRD